MRTLLYVPMVHDPITETGHGTKALISGANRTDKQKAMVELQDFLHWYWSEISIGLSKYKVDKIYFESCIYEDGRGISEIEKMAKRNSPTGIVIKSLIVRGGSLVKTEDIKLYQNSAKLVNKMTSEFMKYGDEYTQSEQYKMLARKTNENDKKRESFIRRRIDETLNIAETGALFLGNGHTIETPVNCNIIYIYDKKLLELQTNKITDIFA